MYTLYKRYIHFMYTLYTLYTYFIYSLYTLYAYFIYTLYILYIHFMNTLYILYIHFMYTLYTLYIYFIYTFMCQIRAYRFGQIWILHLNFYLTNGRWRKKQILKNMFFSTPTISKVIILNNNKV